MASPDYLYPDFSVPQAKQIELMRRLHKEHPDYFELSPYPDEIGRYFRAWFDKPLGTTVPEAGDPAYVDPRVEQLTGDDKYDQLYKEAVEVYAGLRAAKPSGADSAETMTYYRTAANLMEKLISHQERMLGLKRIHEFHTIMIDIMENVMNADQRNAAVDRLKAAIKG